MEVAETGSCRWRVEVLRLGRHTKMLCDGADETVPQTLAFDDPHREDHHRGAVFTRQDLLEQLAASQAPMVYIPSHGGISPAPHIDGGGCEPRVVRDELLDAIARRRRPLQALILDVCHTASDDWWSNTVGPVPYPVLGGGRRKEEGGAIAESVLERKDAKPLIEAIDAEIRDATPDLTAQQMLKDALSKHSRRLKKYAVRPPLN